MSAASSPAKRRRLGEAKVTRIGVLALQGAFRGQCAERPSERAGMPVRVALSVCRCDCLLLAQQEDRTAIDRRLAAAGRSPLAAAAAAAAEHGDMMRQLHGTLVSEVRRPDELEDIDALIIPGGESTAFKVIAQRGNMVSQPADIADVAPAAACPCPSLWARRSGSNAVSSDPPPAAAPDTLPRAALPRLPPRSLVDDAATTVPPRPAAGALARVDLERQAHLGNLRRSDPTREPSPGPHERSRPRPSPPPWPPRPMRARPPPPTRRVHWTAFCSAQCVGQGDKAVDKESESGLLGGPVGGVGRQRPARALSLSPVSLLSLSSLSRPSPFAAIGHGHTPLPRDHLAFHSARRPPLPPPARSSPGPGLPSHPPGSAGTPVPSPAHRCCACPCLAGST